LHLPRSRQNSSLYRFDFHKARAGSTCPASASYSESGNLKSLPENRLSKSDVILVRVFPSSLQKRNAIVIHCNMLRIQEDCSLSISIYVHRQNRRTSFIDSFLFGYGNNSTSAKIRPSFVSLFCSLLERRELKRVSHALHILTKYLVPTFGQIISVLTEAL
jgi:hypothetical protein